MLLLVNRFQGNLLVPGESRLLVDDMEQQPAKIIVPSIRGL